MWDDQQLRDLIPEARVQVAAPFGVQTPQLSSRLRSLKSCTINSSSVVFLFLSVTQVGLSSQSTVKFYLQLVTEFPMAICSIAQVYRLIVSLIFLVSVVSTPCFHLEALLAAQARLPNSTTYKSISST